MSDIVRDIFRVAFRVVTLSFRVVALVLSSRSHVYAVVFAVYFDVVWRLLCDVRHYLLLGRNYTPLDGTVSILITSLSLS